MLGIIDFIDSSPLELTLTMAITFVTNLRSFILFPIICNYSGN